MTDRIEPTQEGVKKLSDLIFKSVDGNLVDLIWGPTIDLEDELLLEYNDKEDISKDD